MNPMALTNNMGKLLAAYFLSEVDCSGLEDFPNSNCFLCNKDTEMCVG